MSSFPTHTDRLTCRSLCLSLKLLEFSSAAAEKLTHVCVQQLILFNMSEQKKTGREITEQNERSKNIPRCDDAPGSARGVNDVILTGYSSDPLLRPPSS